MELHINIAFVAIKMAACDVIARLNALIPMELFNNLSNAAGNCRRWILGAYQEFTIIKPASRKKERKKLPSSNNNSSSMPR